MIPWSCCTNRNTTSAGTSPSTERTRLGPGPVVGQSRLNWHGARRAGRSGEAAKGAAIHQQLSSCSDKSHLQLLPTWLAPQTDWHWVPGRASLDVMSCSAVSLRSSFSGARRTHAVLEPGEKGKERTLTRGMMQQNILQGGAYWIVPHLQNNGWYQPESGLNQLHCSIVK